MRSQRKLKNQEVDIADLYALKVKALWQSLRKENISFWMLCTYYFFEYVRPQSIYVQMDVLPWTQVALLATLVGVFLDKSVKWVSNPINILFILFIIIVILSGFFAFNPAYAWSERNIILTWFIIYFLTITIVNSERRLILFFLAYLLFSFKMSQHGAIVWVQRGFSFAGWGLSGSPGWFRNSGEYAIQMLIYGSLAIAFVYALRGCWGRYKKWFMYVAAATGYMAIMGASSRGAQIGLAVIGVWVLLKLENGPKGLLSLVVISMALYYILPDEQLQRFNEMGDDLNSLQRLAYWQYGLDYVIAKYPVLGVGYRNWMPYLNYMVPEGIGPMQLVQECHNIYIQAASELGIVGLMCFLWLIVYAFIVNARTRALAQTLDKKHFAILAYGLDAGLIGYLVAGTFVTVLYYPFFWIQISMIVMLYSVASRLASEAA